MRCMLLGSGAAGLLATRDVAIHGQPVWPVAHQQGQPFMALKALSLAHWPRCPSVRGHFGDLQLDVVGGRLKQCCIVVVVIVVVIQAAGILNHDDLLGRPPR